jgi:hypothetical protein
MAAFEAMCEGFFFKFACFKDGSRVATIGCANL